MKAKAEYSSTEVPWRPIQFLGSKLRSLDQIALAIETIQSEPTSVWDPFSGSSVVSQRLAADGHQVHAADALRSSATIAAALLGVGRPRDPDELSMMAKAVVAHAQAAEFPEWRHWLGQEQDALSKGDGERLLAVSSSIPQRWNNLDRSSDLAEIFGNAERAAAMKLPFAPALLNTTYAGTYFGLQQALMLDALREGIDRVSGDAPETKWNRNALLTALFAAASAAVFSPGKHFAQPHRVRIGKDLRFHARRMLDDCNVDVVDRFLRAVEKIGQEARPGNEGHRAANCLVSDTPEGELRRKGVSIVYADPPYTAQQYSRFYHVLETLASSVPPVLQVIKGRVTRGLYPEGRYLSPFSSRTRAPMAFRNLIGKAKSSGASMVMSYSAARGGGTGNARIVSLEEIVGWMRDAYGVKVSVDQLDFRYRQFNTSQVGVDERYDPEFLIVGYAHAG